jgi:hypothetical protein
MHRSWFTPAARAAAPLALAALAACGSDSSTGPSGSGLTTAQKTTIITTLGRADVRTSLSSSGNFLVGYGLSEGSTLGLSNIGTISFGAAPSGNRLVRGNQLVLTPSAATITGPTGSYSAFGAQLVLTDSSATALHHGVWTGLIAFDNLDNPTTIIAAGVFSDNVTSVTSTPATNFDLADETRFATGMYIKLTGPTTNTAYSTLGATSPAGSMAITNASFSGSTSCGPGLPPSIPQCAYGSGSVAGNFGFTAQQVDGTDTVTIPNTTFDIPSSQTTIYFDETLAP